MNPTQRKRVAVVEQRGHMYQPEALTITVDGQPMQATAMWDRLRDGGTTRVETEAGMLYKPTPLHPEREATLAGEPIDLSWEVVDV